MGCQRLPLLPPCAAAHTNPPLPPRPTNSNGTLPQQWGAEETSMRQLSVLRLSSNSLTGTLPEQARARGAWLQSGAVGRLPC